MPFTPFRLLHPAPAAARLFARRLKAVPLLLAALWCNAFVAGPASSQTVGVQFVQEGLALAPTDIAGVIPQANFNPVSVSYVAGTDGTTPALVDSDGNPTAITLTHDSSDGYFTSLDTSSPNGVLLYGEDKSTLNSEQSPTFVPGGTATYTFNNVPPGVYNLVAYTECDTPGVLANLTVGATTYYVTDEAATGTPAFLLANNTDPAQRPVGNYVEFFNVVPSNNQIILTNTSEGGGNDSAALNGLQLQPAPTPAGTVQFDTASNNTTESAGSIALTVSRAGGSLGAVTVDYATSDATALAGTDYTATTGTLTWADGDTADKNFTVPITDRQVFDGSTVSFNVSLTNATGGVIIGTVPTATVSILDNDAAPQPTIAIASPPNDATFVVGESVPFAASVTDPGGLLSSVTISVNGLPVYQSSGHGPFVKNVDTSPFAPGTYVVTATATDNQGRANSSTITATLIAASMGSNPPTAAVFTPLLDANGQPRNLAAGSTVTISFTAASADGSDLAKVSLYADGLLVAAFDGAGNALPTAASAARAVRRDAPTASGVGAVFQTPYTLPGADKLVNLVAVALDKLGQSTVSNVATIHSTVTNDKAPLVTLAGLASGTHVKRGTTTTISVSASDPDALTNLVPAGLARADAAGNAQLAALEYFINGISQGKSLQPPFSFDFSPPTSGKYVLSAVATDGAGLATISDPINATVDPVATTVSLAAGGTGEAVEGGANGVVIVTRASTDNSAPLTVSYKVKGAAVAGVDYKKLPGTVTIPAGASKAKIKLKPIKDSPNSSTLKVKFVLLPSSDGSYTIGTGTAKLKLVGF